MDLDAFVATVGIVATVAFVAFVAPPFPVDDDTRASNLCVALFKCIFSRSMIAAGHTAVITKRR